MVCFGDDRDRHHIRGISRLGGDISVERPAVVGSKLVVYTANAWPVVCADEEVVKKWRSLDLQMCQLGQVQQHLETCGGHDHVCGTRLA